MAEKNEKTELSIAISNYNVAETIRTTLDSIVSQLQNCVEIVVSDNASTDCTPKIVTECQAKFTNIRYFSNRESSWF
jgi:glycosyltransferase involved in cell wall biosynthesis